MEKKRLEIIITAGLAVIFIVVLANSIIKVRAKLRPAAATSAVAPQPAEPKVAAQAAAAQQPQEEEYNLSLSRCPFSGKAYAAKDTAAITNLRLTGIVWDDKKPQALINSRVVQEGDSIGDFTVVKISSDKVTLAKGDKYFELKLAK